MHTHVRLQVYLGHSLRHSDKEQRGCVPGHQQQLSSENGRAARTFLQRSGFSLESKQSSNKQVATSRRVSAAKNATSDKRIRTTVIADAIFENHLADATVSRNPETADSEHAHSGKRTDSVPASLSAGLQAGRLPDRLRALHHSGHRLPLPASLRHAAEDTGRPHGKVQDRALPPVHHIRQLQVRRKMPVCARRLGAKGSQKAPKVQDRAVQDVPLDRFLQLRQTVPLHPQGQLAHRRRAPELGVFRRLLFL